MFRCQMCETVCPPKTRTSRIVVKTRPKEYESRGPDPSERRRFSRTRGRRPSRKEYDKGGEGHEIVRELVVCPKCAAKFQDPEPVQTGLESGTMEGSL